MQPMQRQEEPRSPYDRQSRRDLQEASSPETKTNVKEVCPGLALKRTLESDLDQAHHHDLQELRHHLQYLLKSDFPVPAPLFTAVCNEGSKDESQTWEESSDTAASPAKRARREVAGGVIIAPSWREGAIAASELLMRRKLETAADGEKLELTLRQIHYSQDSVQGKFRDGRSLAQMRTELQKGEKTLQEIPKITAVIHEGTVYSADNRRLWTFKHSGLPLETRVPIVAGRPDERFFKKLTTPTLGRTVRRRAVDGF